MSGNTLVAFGMNLFRDMEVSYEKENPRPADMLYCVLTDLETSLSSDWSRNSAVFLAESLYILLLAQDMKVEEFTDQFKESVPPSGGWDDVLYRAWGYVRKIRNVRSPKGKLLARKATFCMLVAINQLSRLCCGGTIFKA